MGVYEKISGIFAHPLTDYAIRYGYDEDNILILEGNEDELRRKYLDTYRNLLSCRHKADGRSTIEYGKDLVASWIFEDHMFRLLKSDQYTIRLAGGDRNRKILTDEDVSTSSDFEVQRFGDTYKMELVSDYNCFWKKTGKMHLRDDKYDSLREAGGMLLAISTKDKTFMLFDLREDIPHTWIESHEPFHGKAACELYIRWRGITLNRENLSHEIVQWLESIRR